MADRRERMALLSRYSKLHTARYGEKPTLNYNSEQWAADALIESYGLGYCYDLLAYYFDGANSPNWKAFAYQAEAIIQSKSEIEKDIRERRERMALARKWLND